MKRFKEAEKRYVIIGLLLVLILLIAIIWNMFPFYKNLQKNYDSQGLSDKVTNEDRTENPDATKFNSSFLPYMGDDMTQQQMISLIQLVSTTNVINKEHQITWGKNSISNMEQLKPNQTYKVTVKYDDEKYINEINIQRVGK